ncbi:serine/arginine repetitive matrix protein 2 isoform X2 [Folsomia candida]|uniref:serine/arginine repetitive matrix protein 2 isoform X2 n=1 Tax=Folsomia candida TaxID=158441 RepID=UPI001605191C|nr:serine/arginine repetitive matrix protein 2 isoform X2 [Folsomia candida]
MAHVPLSRLSIQRIHDHWAPWLIEKGVIDAPSPMQESSNDQVGRMENLEVEAVPTVIPLPPPHEHIEAVPRLTENLGVAAVPTVISLPPSHETMRLENLEVEKDQLNWNFTPVRRCRTKKPSPIRSSVSTRAMASRRNKSTTGTAGKNPPASASSTTAVRNNGNRGRSREKMKHTEPKKKPDASVDKDRSRSPHRKTSSSPVKPVNPQSGSPAVPKSIPGKNWVKPGLDLNSIVDEPRHRRTTDHGNKSTTAEKPKRVPVSPTGAVVLRANGNRSRSRDKKKTEEKKEANRRSWSPRREITNPLARRAGLIIAKSPSPPESSDDEDPLSEDEQDVDFTPGRRNLIRTSSPAPSSVSTRSMISRRNSSTSEETTEKNRPVSPTGSVYGLENRGRSRDKMDNHERKRKANGEVDNGWSRSRSPHREYDSNPVTPPARKAKVGLTVAPEPQSEQASNDEPNGMLEVEAVETVAVQSLHELNNEEPKLVKNSEVEPAPTAGPLPPPAPQESNNAKENVVVEEERPDLDFTPARTLAKKSRPTRSSVSMSTRAMSPRNKSTTGSAEKHKLVRGLDEKKKASTKVHEARSPHRKTNLSPVKPLNGLRGSPRSAVASPGQKWNSDLDLDAIVPGKRHRGTPFYGSPNSRSASKNAPKASVQSRNKDVGIVKKNMVTKAARREVTDKNVGGQKVNNAVNMGAGNVIEAIKPPKADSMTEAVKAQKAVSIPGMGDGQGGEIRVGSDRKKAKIAVNMGGDVIEAVKAQKAESIRGMGNEQGDGIRVGSDRKKAKDVVKIAAGNMTEAVKATKATKPRSTHGMGDEQGGEIRLDNDRQKAKDIVSKASDVVKNGKVPNAVSALGLGDEQGGQISVDDAVRAPIIDTAANEEAMEAKMNDLLTEHINSLGENEIKAFCRRHAVRVLRSSNMCRDEDLTQLFNPVAMLIEKFNAEAQRPN